MVVSRDKPYVLDLLSCYGIQNVCISRPRNGFVGLFCEWVRRTASVIKLHRVHGFDVAIGTSVSIPYLSLLFGVKSINVQEDDDAVIPLHAILAYPWSSIIVNPKCLKYRFFRSRRYLHDSLHEMAYLSAETFKRDPSVVKKYGFEPYEYVIIRKVALTAHHDFGESGLSIEHIRRLQHYFPSTPQITSDELKESEVAIEDMHQILAHAQLVLTDSQTMTAEAGCLGVPAVRVSSFFQKLSYLSELESLGLTYGCHPSDFEKFESILESLSQQSIQASRILENRNLVIQKYGDFNSVLLKAIENTT